MIGEEGIILLFVGAEEMVAGLQQVPWWRVDVSFSKAKATYQAHNLIQVLISLHISDERPESLPIIPNFIKHLFESKMNHLDKGKRFCGSLSGFHLGVTHYTLSSRQSKPSSIASLSSAT